MGTYTELSMRTLERFQDEFPSFYTKEDLLRRLDHVMDAPESELYMSKMELFEVLDAGGVPYEKEMTKPQLKAVVQKAVKSNQFPSYRNLDQKFLLALYDRYALYPSPEDYIRRIVDNCCRPEDHWENDSLRLRILKQFIKYGNCLDDAGFNGRLAVQRYAKEKSGKKKVTQEEILDALDDGVFAPLAGANKDQKKSDGTYGLLKLSDDLASGKFRAGGATKRGLYLFAMAFFMTYRSKDPKPGTDVERDLFQDYYANNLMRFLTDAYQGNKSEFSDPSGQGVNYKNFAEAISLYFISRDGLSPQEKIARSSRMIEAVQASAGSAPRDTDNATRYYKDFFLDGLAMSEAEFQQYIEENYNCNTAGKGVWELEPSQNSAYKVYLSILRDLKKEEKKIVPSEPLNLGDSFKPALELDTSSGLWFSENGLFETPESFPKGVDPDRFQQLLDLLKAANRYMKKAVNMDLLDPGAEKQTNAVSRTSILAAYYYYFCILFDGEEKLSFQEVFEEFKYGVDEKLEKAYYPPLSPKNIFDVLVVFSAYAQLYL